MEKAKKKPFINKEWQEQLALPELPSALLLCAMLFFSCLALPLCDAPVLSGIFFVACLIFGYLLLRRIRSLFYYALPCLLLFFLGNLMPGDRTPKLLAVVFLAIVVGGSCGAYLFGALKKPWHRAALCAVAPIAYGITFLITRDPLRGLLSLLPLTIAVVAALCLLHLCDRASATALIAASLIGILAVAGLITMAAMGTLQGNPLTTAGDLLHKGITDRFAQTVALYEEMQAHYAELGITIDIPEMDYVALADALVNIFPGLFLATCAVTAHLTWRLLLQQLITLNASGRVPFHVIAFRVSRVGAVLYLLCGLVALFAGNPTVFSTVCLNITIALAPGLAMIGFISLLQGARSCLSLLLTIGVIVLTVRNPASGLAVAATIGAMQTLLARFLPHPENPNDYHNKGGD